MASVPEQLAMPPGMWQSRLLQRGGIFHVRGLLPGVTLQALVADLAMQRDKGTRSLCVGPNEAEWRGGEPARALTSIPAGPIAWQVYGAAPLWEAVSSLCGFSVHATGAGIYSAYDEPGDFLALHRDIDTCDIAVITCLEEQGQAVARLRAYPDFAHQPLSRVDRRQGVDVPLAVGETVIIAGGIVPHEVTPIGFGQRRAVAITCFQPLES